MHELQHVYSKSVCTVFPEVFGVCFSCRLSQPSLSWCFHVLPCVSPLPVFPVPPACVVLCCVVLCCVVLCVCGLFLLFIVHTCLRSAHLFLPLCAPASPQFVSLQHMFSSVVSPPRWTHVRARSYCLLAVFFISSLCFLVLNACFLRASGSSTHLSACLQPSRHHAAFVIPNLPRVFLAHASPASAITLPHLLPPLSSSSLLSSVSCLP